MQNHINFETSECQRDKTTFFQTPSERNLLLALAAFGRYEVGQGPFLEDLWCYDVPAADLQLSGKVVDWCYRRLFALLLLLLLLVVAAASSWCWLLSYYQYLY